MSSRDGFARADVDVGLLHDPKVLALARRLRDPVRTCCALILYEAALLASWKADERLTIVESAPAWWLDDPAEYQSELEAVGLLDAEGRVLERAYLAWTARARAASEAASAAATARWDKARAKREQSDGDATAERLQSDGNAAAMPSLPAGQPAAPTGQPGRPRTGRKSAPAGRPERPPARHDSSHETVLADGVVWCGTCDLAITG